MNPQDFTIEQHKMLRHEVMGIVAETRRLEILILGGLAAYYGWVFTHDIRDNWVWSIPPILSFLAGLRCLGLYKRISEIASYLKQIEAFVLPPTATTPPLYPSGWEHFRCSSLGSPLLGSATLFWIVIVLLTALGGWHFSHSVSVGKAIQEATSVTIETTLPQK